MNMLSPSGERVDLTGEWDGTGALVHSNESFALVQLGDCVFGSATYINPEGHQETLAIISGQLTPTLELPTEAVILIQGTVLPMAVASDLVLQVDWDAAGQIEIREDREPGEVAGRCRPQQFATCPDPLILHPVDGLPEPS